MKKIFFPIMMAALLMTACGHRATSADSSNADSASVDSTASADILNAMLQTDSVGMVREDSMAIASVIIDWPVKGSEALVKNIRQYICEEIASDPYDEGKPDVILFDDGKKAVQTIVNKHYSALLEAWKRDHEGGFNEGMSYSAYKHVFKLEATDRYVTYMSNAEGFMGGAHGYATSTGQTFRMSDGKLIGYQTEYNQKTESFEIKDQTLFSDAQAPKLFALIKEGVRSYFSEAEQEASSDEDLKDMLIGVDDVNRIPLPTAAPYFTKEGLCFVYQQYEIAPYAAGMINFTIPYDKIRPFLTPEAQELIK